MTVISIPKLHTRALSESFVPVLLVLLSLFFLLAFIQYKVETSASQVTVIEIPLSANSALLDTNSELGDSVETMVEISEKGNFSPVVKNAANLISAKNWNAASTLYEKELKKGESSRLRSELGRIYLYKGDTKSAVKELTRATQLKPPYPMAWFYLGVATSKSGNVSRAEFAYQSLLKAIPSHFEGHINLALILLKQNKLMDANRILQAATKIVGGKREAYAQYLLALNYMRLNGKDNERLAVKALNRAIRLQPDYIEARIRLIPLTLDLRTEEGYSEAIKRFNNILELKPNYAPAYFSLAKINNEAGRKIDAIRHYQQAILYNPAYRTARKNLGLIFLDQKKWQLAGEQFQWLASNFPDDSKNFFLLGKAAYGEKRFEEAIAQYNKAISLKPDSYPEAHLNIGLAYAKLGQIKEAKNQYNKAIRLKNAYPKAWYNLGLLYKKEDNLIQAKKCLLKATEQDNNYEQAWFNLALVYTKANDISKAISAYKEAIRISPRYNAAKLNLAVRYSKQGDTTNAIKLYREVLADDPSYTSAWINLGVSFLKTKQFKEAENAFSQAISLDPENTKALSNKANALTQMGEFSSAKVVLQTAIDLDVKDVSLRIQLSRNLRDGGNLNLAKKEIEKALLLDPKNKEAASVHSSILQRL
ncbi:MAG: tetratricopeptide repeat protein [Gammaproteobacteria bacterium]|nr:tetratricopeptide repeat protein [Gammaproteobacteria bacterium]